MKVDQISLLATVAATFAALVVLVLTGQAGIREDSRALQAEMRAGQAELRAGQDRLREDLAGLGARLAVVEHRTDVLETRFAVVEQRTVEWPVVVDAPAVGSEPFASPSGPSPRTTPVR